MGFSGSIQEILNRALNTDGTALKVDLGSSTLNVEHLEANTDQVESKLDTVNSNLTTLLSQTDGLEGSLTSIDSKTPSAPAIAAKQDTANASLASIDSKLGANPKSGTANLPAIITSGGDALAATAGRKSWRIQNLGTSVLFVRLGTGASSTVFHVALKGGLTNDDASGGIIEDDQWTGIVSVAGTSPRFVATELT